MHLLYIHIEIVIYLLPPPTLSLSLKGSTASSEDYDGNDMVPGVLCDRISHGKFWHTRASSDGLAKCPPCWKHVVVCVFLICSLLKEFCVSPRRRIFGREPPKRKLTKKKSPPFSFESSILTRCSKFRLSVKATLLRVRKHLPRTFRKIVRMPVELWHVSGSREFF